MKSATKRSSIALALALFVAVGALGACGAEDDPDPANAAEAPDFSPAIDAAPPKLAALYERGGVIVDGGLDAYERQVAALEGNPVVVNKWASWCAPCRAEFPHLQQQAAEHADEVAFLGVNSEDSRDAAETFLRDHPVPYPSFYDPDSEIAAALDVRIEFPATAFYDRDGELVHARRGVYATERELAADIERYALGG